MKDITFCIFENQGESSGFTSFSVDFSFREELTYGQRGLRLLIQLIIKWLLTTPGHDVISPDIGGGLMELVGLSPGDEASTEVLIKQSIDACEDQIKKYQMGKNYPDSEMLEKIDIDPNNRIFFDDENMRWNINLIVSSKAGESARFSAEVG